MLFPHLTPSHHTSDRRRKLDPEQRERVHKKAFPSKDQALGQSKLMANQEEVEVRSKEQEHDADSTTEKSLRLDGLDSQNQAPRPTAKKA